MDRRGQLSSAMVWGVVVMLIAVSLGGLIFGKVQGVARETTESSGTTYTYENSLDNTGTAYLTAYLHDELKSATLAQDYNYSDVVYENIYVNDTLVYENSSINGSGSLSIDVASYVKDGTNTFKVSVDNTNRINNITTTLTVQSYAKSVEENIVGETGTTAGDIFPLILLMVLIAVLVGIVAVIRTLG